MKKAVFWLTFTFCNLLLLSPGVIAEEKRVIQVLDAFHEAASKAEGNKYFSLLHDDSVFMGTDATERWSKSQFQQFAKPYFDQGKGWTYLVDTRHVTLSEDGKIAWFDEMLTNVSYGVCRGSGVLIKGVKGWQIMQYNLSIPLPNDIAKDIVKQIKAHTGK